MHAHETELERRVRSRAKEAAHEVSSAPESGLVELASAVGNQAFSRASASIRRSARVRARTATAIVARNGDEPEDPGLDDAQKARMRAMCVDPVRSAAGKLAAGEKADVRSVIRHLRPVVTALNGFSSKGATRATIQSATERLSFDITGLDSVALNDKQAIFLARTAWQAARRQVAATRRQLKAPAGAAPEDVSAIAEGRAHLEALSQQIAATIQDLVEGPRTQEGFKEVGDTAVQVVQQFDSFTLEGDVPPSFSAAKTKMMEGVARLAPLALGKEEVLKEIKDSLSGIANDLAGISDGEVEAEPEPEESDAAEEEPEAGADEDEEEEEEEEPKTPAKRPVPVP